MSETNDWGRAAAVTSVAERLAAIDAYLDRFDAALAEERVELTYDGFLTMLELGQHLMSRDASGIQGRHRERFKRISDGYVVRMLGRLDPEQEISSHDIGRLAALAQRYADPEAKAAVLALCDQFLGVVLAGVGTGHAPLSADGLRGVADLAALIRANPL